MFCIYWGFFSNIIAVAEQCMLIFFVCQNYFNPSTVCFIWLTFRSMINLYKVCRILLWCIQPSVLIPCLIFYKIFHIYHAMCYSTFGIKSYCWKGILQLKWMNNEQYHIKSYCVFPFSILTRVFPQTYKHLYADTCTVAAKLILQSLFVTEYEKFVTQV